MRLTSDQIDEVRNVVDSSGIEIQSLRDDLHDHLCCVIEEKLDPDNNITFNELLIDAVNEFFGIMGQLMNRVALQETLQTT